MVDFTEGTTLKMWLFKFSVSEVQIAKYFCTKWDRQLHNLVLSHSNMKFPSIHPFRSCYNSERDILASNNQDFINKSRSNV